MGDYTEPEECVTVTIESGGPEIVLKGPPEETVTEHMKLKNSSDKKIGFVTKLTSTPYYTVTPSKAFIDPQGEREVKITRKPLKADQKKMPKEQDRFSIIYVVLPEDETRIDAQKVLKASYKVVVVPIKHVMEAAGEAPPPDAAPASPTE